ncbi:MAG: peptide chain release factor N(5)-glutamine methyltransferase [Pseudomonadota bacterium]
MSRSVGEALTDLRGRLTAAGIENPAREARLIVAAALGIGHDRVGVMQPDPLPEPAEDHLSAMAARRCGREPLSHILGLRAFYEHEFRVTSDVLDPRPETEVLVRAALAVPFERVMDLGTGSGCILLSMLAERPNAVGVGTDVSEAALTVAAENAERLGLAHRATMKVSDWFDQVEGCFDLIVSNPPYIAAADMAALDPELTYEPRVALTDEADGLTAYRAIVAAAPTFLNPKGWLMVETGWTQGPQVAVLFQEAGFESVKILPDLDGRDRVVQGCMRHEAK